METFTEDQQVITAERRPAWEEKARLRGKANTWKITILTSAALLVLWVVGMITGRTLGGTIYILLLIAVVALVIQVVRARRSIL